MHGLPIKEAIGWWTILRSFPADLPRQYRQINNNAAGLLGWNQSTRLTWTCSWMSARLAICAKRPTSTTTNNLLFPAAIYRRHAVTTISTLEKHDSKALCTTNANITTMYLWEFKPVYICCSLLPTIFLAFLSCVTAPVALSTDWGNRVCVSMFRVIRWTLMTLTFDLYTEI